jgi:hypothetical protein
MNEIRVPVGKFFRRLGEAYDIHVYADWHALGNSGWTSDSIAPGWIEEKTVGDIISETAHGLNAFVYVVDEKTVWITSPPAANNIFLLKAYKVGDNERLSAQRLAQLLRDSLGDQLNQPGVNVYFMAKQNLVVLRASQTLHRQVHAVFNEID